MISDIVRVIDPRPDEIVVEIGPGQAALTDGLLARIESMAAIELDRDLAAWLRRRYGAERLHLFEQDALRTDYGALARELGASRGNAAPVAIRLVGNLPYNISSPLLVHLTGFRDLIVDQHFMLQKEVVDRICAGPGGADYGRLGVLLQSCYQVEALLDVPPFAFSPPPKVMSAVIRMQPLPQADAVPMAELQEVLAQAFAHRRKMMRKTLIPWLERCGIGHQALEPSARPEEVPVDVYLALARELRERRGGAAASSSDMRSGG